MDGFSSLLQAEGFQPRQKVFHSDNTLWGFAIGSVRTLGEYFLSSDTMKGNSLVMSFSKYMEEKILFFKHLSLKGHNEKGRERTSFFFGLLCSWVGWAMGQNHGMESLWYLTRRETKLLVNGCICVSMVMSISNFDSPPLLFKTQMSVLYQSQELREGIFSL